MRINKVEYTYLKEKGEALASNLARKARPGLPSRSEARRRPASPLLMSPSVASILLARVRRGADRPIRLKANETRSLQL